MVRSKVGSIAKKQPDMLEIPFSQIPNSLIEFIAKRVNSYSAALIKVVVDKEGRNKDYQIGSGTLVSIGNTHGILTAQHVSRELVGRCKLGLPLIQDEHRHEIEKDYLNIIEIASTEIPSEGPDLAFIALPAQVVGTIKAVKSFFNLSFDRDELLRNPPPLDSGNWFISGTPGVLTADEESEKGYRGVYSFHSMCYETSELREYTRGDYDYIEVDVDYGTSTDVPLTFGGMSGGGLWQVFIRQSHEGVLELRKHLLSGVIFYQSPLNNQHRFIRCQGRRSIYEHVCTRVEKCQ